MYEWVGAEDGVYRFATDVLDEEVRLCLRLQGDASPGARPPLVLPPDAGARVVSIRPASPAGRHDIVLAVAPPAGGAGGELRLTVGGPPEAGAPEAGAPACQVRLRRVDCRLNTALLEGDPAVSLPGSPTRAALLWQACGRYSELLGLKRFTSGFSDSDVFVFRPRLRPPPCDHPIVAGLQALQAVAPPWGACLLVKTGTRDAIWQEWERFRLFLSDRLHPFMARSEAFLAVRAVGETFAEDEQATLISSFLGGDLLQGRSLDTLLGAGERPEPIESAVEQIFAATGVWYAGHGVAPLGQWRRMFRAAGGAAGLQLFRFGDRRLDLADEAQRRRFTGPLMWDVDFVTERHLVGHLLGGEGDGLLPRLMDLPVRYSVVHGDLHPHNILLDAGHAWLIDFAATSIGPTLYDFAKLEVNVRLRSLAPAPSPRNLEEASAPFERLLLDHFTASAGSLEPVWGMAPDMGVAPRDLVQLARCIAAIRCCALPYSLGDPDRRDYLAVLYLTVLQALQFAGGEPERIGGYRLLMALFWLLEDTLSRIVGLTPCSRRRVAVRPESLLEADWLASAGAPRRVLYWLERPEGREALAPLAANRGVLQGRNHHLDVLDHTLLTLANLEVILEDPVAALLDPARVDRRARIDLGRQGIDLPPPADSARGPLGPVGDWVLPWAEEVRARLERHLTPDRRLLVKWAALFHDVGKAGARIVTPARPRPRIQFLGHEVYGLQLVEGRLQTLFPCPQARQTARDLIRRHHLHHLLARRYLHAGRLQALQRALAGDDLAAAERRRLLPLFDPRGADPVRDFPLLVLQGYADALAVRGPAMASPLQRVAEIDLALLALCFRYPALRHRLAMEEAFGGLMGELARELIEAGVPRHRLGRVRAELRALFLERACPPGATEPPDSLPTLDDLRRWAAARRGSAW